jgi:hypothetical protein
MAQSHPIVYTKMQSSPLHKASQSRAKIPIRVICVVEDLKDMNTEPIKAVQQHCVSSDVYYEIREYDSDKHSQDRNNITSLPAYHIYMKSSYTKTFYPTNRPFQIINECIEEYHAKRTLKLEKKQRWATFWNTLSGKRLTAQSS